MTSEHGCDPVHLCNLIWPSSQKSLRRKGAHAQGQHKKYRSEQCKAEDDAPDSVHRPPLVSLPELLSGEQIINTNRSANILKSNLYVCPICGNIFHSTGSAMISCCGVTLPALEAEQADEEHQIKCEKIEDEFFISMQHPMTKEHYISFVVYCTGERFESVKLYPESSIEVRFFSRGHGTLYWYCNHHGLFKKRI